MGEWRSRPGINAAYGERPGRGAFSGYGVIRGMPDADGAMGDLGGGRLELVALANGQLGASSTPAGRAVAPDVVGQGDPKKIVVEAVENVALAARGPASKTFYAAGGAWRSFARLHMEQAGYPPHIIHQLRDLCRGARAVARLIAVQSAKSPEKMPARRADAPTTLPPACLALDRLLGALQPQQRRLLGVRLARGLLLFATERTERARHPLIAFAEEQGAGWRRFDLPPQEIFDWLTPAFAGESDAERVLRTAACHLSDISWDDHPDYRADQAYFRVLHLPAPGMNHRERAVLAMALTYRYKSDPKAGDDRYRAAA